MDWFDETSAPAEYQQVAWIANLAQLAQGVGWAINYISMVYQSFTDRTYGMGILPLCCNFAWEFVYTFVYPSQNYAEKVVISVYMILNLLVIYSAVRYSPREWGHVPLVQRNLPYIFCAGILGFMSGHIALAKTVGQGLAANWGAFICLELICIGACCQLLSRNSSRGTSYTIWLSRFLGSYIGIVSLFVRGAYWPEEFWWLRSPMVKWHSAVVIGLDVSYFFLLYRIRQREKHHDRIPPQKADK